MVYFVQGLDSGEIKIGFTDRMQERMKQLDDYFGEPIRVLGVLSGDRDKEAQMHLLFREHRVRSNREFFRPHKDIIDFVFANCEKWEERDDKPIKIDRMVAADLRYIAEHRGLSLAEYVSELVRPIAAKEHARILGESNR